MDSDTDTDAGDGVCEKPRDVTCQESVTPKAPKVRIVRVVFAAPTAHDAHDAHDTDDIKDGRGRKAQESARALRIDPDVLGSRSNYFAALLSGRMDDAYADKECKETLIVDVLVASADKVEPTVAVIEMANSPTGESLDTSSIPQAMLFEMSIQAFNLCLDQVSHSLTAELERRLTCGLCHTFIGAPDEFTQGVGKDLVARAKEKFINTNDLSRGFANLEFAHVEVLLQDPYMAAHDNCSFGFVLDWLKEARFLNGRDRRDKAERLIRLLQFSAMNPFFLRNIVAVDKTLCGGDEKLVSLMKSRVSEAFVDIACAKCPGPRSRLGKKEQMHPTVIRCTFPWNRLELAADPKDNVFEKVRGSDLVCVDGFWMSLVIIRSPGHDFIKLGLCLDDEKTGLGNDFKLQFKADVVQCIEGSLFHLLSIACNFSQVQTIHELVDLIMVDRRDVERSKAPDFTFVVTVRRIRADD